MDRQHWGELSKYLAEYKAGVLPPNAKKPGAKPKRRVKTLQNMIHMDGFVQNLTKGKKTLYTYFVERGEDGRITSDPYLWELLNSCTDRAPDNVCTKHYFDHIGLCVNFDFDEDHDGANIQKGALHDTKLYRFVTLIAGCLNLAYGSMMSPPRLKQIQQALVHHWSSHTPSSDQWFQFWLPYMLVQLQSITYINPASPTAAQDAFNDIVEPFFITGKQVTITIRF